MGQVLIRNLDDRIIESLRRKAELHGRSLEAELRLVLTEAASLSPHEKETAARRFLAGQVVQPIEGWELIRADRDSR